MNDARELVFVYGTLRRGSSNDFRMAGAEFVAAGSVRGSIYRIDWYPGLVLEEAGDVIGEIYEVEPWLLAELDLFEGLPVGETEGSEYRRVRADTIAADGRKFSAWVWEWLGPVDDFKKVTGGDWLETADR